MTPRPFLGFGRRVEEGRKAQSGLRWPAGRGELAWGDIHGCVTEDKSPCHCSARYLSTVVTAKCAQEGAPAGVRLRRARPPCRAHGHSAARSALRRVQVPPAALPCSPCRSSRASLTFASHTMTFTGNVSARRQPLSPGFPAGHPGHGDGLSLAPMSRAAVPCLAEGGRGAT